MIVHEKTGGRTVQLFVPFEVKGKKIEAIVFAPVRFGHTVRWSEGAWQTSIELLVELAGVEEAVIRELRYPDAERVMEVFLGMLPTELRTDIVEGRIPQKREEVQPQEPQREVPLTNGSGQQMGPGAPLPPMAETGFDLSDEQP